jgi:CRP/FNR family transcriptional regulator, anaerobic regulatory protein
VSESLYLKALFRSFSFQQELLFGVKVIKDDILNSIENAYNNPVSCRDCRMSTLCIPLSLRSDELYKLDQIIQRGSPFQMRQAVFNSGDKFTAVYAVRSGSIKSFCIDNDGREQVTGFYLPGEIFGWDGLAEGYYQNTAIALETTSVCEIPFNQLELLGATLPSIRKHMLKLVGREITADQKLIALLAGNTAHQRLASLLMSISGRLAQQKLSSTRFRLPMSRSEISSYLGLTVETVSRGFSHFKKKGYLTVNKKEVELVDIPGLELLISNPEECE